MRSSALRKPIRVLTDPAGWRRLYSQSSNDFSGLPKPLWIETTHLSRHLGQSDLQARLGPTPDPAFRHAEDHRVAILNDARRLGTSHNPKLHKNESGAESVVIREQAQVSVNQAFRWSHLFDSHGRWNISNYA